MRKHQFGLLLQVDAHLSQIKVKTYAETKLYDIYFLNVPYPRRSQNVLLPTWRVRTNHLRPRYSAHHLITIASALDLLQVHPVTYYPSSFPSHSRTSPSTPFACVARYETRHCDS